jgi:hypothetical protein
VIPKLLRIEPQSTDLAWAAGIIDGEGHIQISRRKLDKPTRKTAGWSFCVRVGNTDPRMTDRLWQLFGGSVQGPRFNRLASRPSYEWVAMSAIGRHVLEAILPYLVVKHDQAEVAIRFAATIRGRKGQPSCLSSEVAQEREQLIDNILALRAREVS